MKIQITQMFSQPHRWDEEKVPGRRGPVKSVQDGICISTKTCFCFLSKCRDIKHDVSTLRDRHLLSVLQLMWTPCDCLYHYCQFWEEFYGGTVFIFQVFDILLTNHYGLIKGIKIDREIPTYCFGLPLSEHLQVPACFKKWQGTCSLKRVIPYHLLFL